MKKNSKRPSWAQDPAWPHEQRYKLIDLLAKVAYYHVDSGSKTLAGNALFAIQTVATATPEVLEAALPGIVLEVGTHK